MAPCPAIPTLEQFLADNVPWLLTAVTTEEASQILSIPVPTLTTWRSRHSDGPMFIRIPNSRIIRYLRLELYRWLLAGGLLQHTGAEGIPIALPSPTGKPPGSADTPQGASSDNVAQGGVLKPVPAGISPSKPNRPPSMKRPSNSPRKQRRAAEASP